VPRFVGVKMGAVSAADDTALEIEVSLEAAPSVLWDGLVIPTGDGVADVLAQSGHALDFLKDQYRHCKPILLLGAAAALLEVARIPSPQGSEAPDPGLLLFPGDDHVTAVSAFVDALAKHRHFDRETDPPRV
jgi:catalase